MADIRITSSHNLFRMYWITDTGRKWIRKTFGVEGFERVQGYKTFYQTDIKSELIGQIKNAGLEVEEL